MHFKYLKEVFTAPFNILRNLYHYRHILVQMVKRDIKGRFAGSMGGLLWNFIHPILMILVYLFVFVYIFKLRVGSGTGSTASVIYLMAGIFPWIIIAEGLARGTASMIENALLIQKTPFPTEILAIKSVLAPLFSHGIAIIILLMYRLITGGEPEIILLLPLILIIQLLFTSGITFLSATATVFFRDVMQLMHIIINFWIFLTPILYPVQMLPEWSRKMMYFNPLFPLISLYQSLFVDGHLPRFKLFSLAVIWSLSFL